MDGCSDHVQTINSATTIASKEVKVDAVPGVFDAGPFMPILSGNYSLNVCEAGAAKDVSPAE
jgi:hypothetical protein